MNILNKGNSCYLCKQKIGLEEHCVTIEGDRRNKLTPYTLCERCYHLYSMYSIDHLEDLKGTIANSGLTRCKGCGVLVGVGARISQDTKSCTCKCDICGQEWVVDLSLKALKHRKQFSRLVVRENG